MSRPWESFVADECCGEGEEGRMEVCAAFVAGRESSWPRNQVIVRSIFHADDEGRTLAVGRDVQPGTRLAPVRNFLRLSCAVSIRTRNRSTRPASAGSSLTRRCDRPGKPAADRIRNRRCTVDFDAPKSPTESTT